ncbi:MAG: GNAT family N-acetyltransferase [SAR202 cluster bacterium]|nr:GNAT family N-acetyltransferase [SAR202 cluster bacterium]
MSIEVIVAAKEQYEDLVVMVAAFRDVLKRTTPVEADIRESLAMLLEQENREFFVARNEAGHSLGYIEQRYEYSMWLSGNEARLENLFVWSEYCRTGVASALIEYAIERAASRECRGITLETNEMNTDSVGLYGKYDFSNETSRYKGGKHLWFTRGI